MLVNTRFQVLFHSPFGVLFTFPSQYCSTIGHRLVFRLRGWSPCLLYQFHVLVLTSDTANFSSVSPTRLSLSSVDLPISFGYIRSCTLLSITPYVFLLMVWPLALSLAATRAISIDFSSSAYLDVSVRRVPFIHLCIQCTITILQIVGLPHSDTCGSGLICSSPQLFAACRVLRRLPMPRHSPCALSSLNFMSFANLFVWVFSCLLAFVVIP